MTISGGGSNKEIVQTVMLSALEALPFNFELCGSRRFGGATLDSDWDFFVQESEEVVEALNSLGFSSAINHYNAPYKDSNLVTVLTCRTARIDIQIRRDAETYSKACRVVEHLLSYGISIPTKAHTTARKRFWNYIIQLVSASPSCAHCASLG